MNRDPRYRARLNQISNTLESANINAQDGLWSFKETYLTPCLQSVSICLESACNPCIGARRERVRARQRRSAATARGRPEFLFDFYNDEWDEAEAEDEQTGLLAGWGADELDRLLAGSGSGAGDIHDGSKQPARKPGMNYGATTNGRVHRRQSTLATQANDPTILPGSSMFGFLERLPWKIGGRGIRYKPSAADLQENLGGKARRGPKADKSHERESGTAEETSALLEEDEENGDSDRAHHHHQTTHRRNRSDTTTSRSTQNSLSSRGDLFPSEDEADDAVPLDDSFALSFTRRSSDGEHEHEHESHSHTENDSSHQSHSSKATTSPASHRSRKPSLARRRTDRRESRNHRASEHEPRTSEMVHSPSTPLTPSASSGAAAEQTRSIFFLPSDAEHDADESTAVSPVAEREDGNLQRRLSSLEDVRKRQIQARLDQHVSEIAEEGNGAGHAYADAGNETIVMSSLHEAPPVKPDDAEESSHA